MRYAWIEEPPFNFAGPAGPDGIDVAVMRAACTLLGEPLHLIRAEFAELVPGLAAGRWDVSAAMFVTPERAVHACFSRVVWKIADGLLVRSDWAGQVRGYASVASLGLRLAVLEGQVQARTAVDCGVAQSQLHLFRDYATAASALRDGRVDAYASVALAHRESTAGHSGLACVVVPDSERPRCAGAFPCATARIRDQLDRGLSGVIGSASHHAMMQAFGLGPDEWPGEFDARP